MWKYNIFKVKLIFLVCAIVSIVVLVILVLFSVKSVDVNEYGLNYSSISKQVHSLLI